MTIESEIYKKLEEKNLPFNHLNFFDENKDLVLKFIRKNTLDLIINAEMELPEEWQYRQIMSVMREGVQKDLSLMEKLEWIKCSIDPIYYCKKYITITLADGEQAKLNPFDYQTDMLDLFDENRFIICCIGRQLGKTSLVAAYLLWVSHFHDNKQSAVLANKAGQAQEIIERIQLSYEMLPVFLKIGVRVYNKRSISFENKSKIFSGPSSKSSIRGKSCVVGNTRIFIKNKKTKHVENITIDKLRTRFEKNKYLFKYTYIKNQKFLNNYDYEVLTPLGWSDFDGLIINHNREIITLDDYDLSCTPAHKVKINSNFIEAKELNHKKIKGLFDVYDLYNVKNGNQYFTNEVISHNCSIIYWDEAAFVNNDWEFYESIFPTLSSGKKTKLIITSTPNGKRGVFYKLWSEEDNGFAKKLAIWSDNPNRDAEWRDQMIAATSDEQFAQEFECEFRGSQNSLIRSSTMLELFHTKPETIYENGLKVYRNSEKEHIYFMGVDVSRGIGGDYSAFTIIDITNQSQYEVVATFRNNKYSSLLYPSLIHNIATKYNDAFVLVEINDIGEQVANILYHDLEYDNTLMTVQEKNRQIIGFNNSSRAGVRTTTKVKSIGCSNLKTLIEKNKLILNDENIIDELANFVPKGKSYEAASGGNDDLVMSLVLFAWAMTQTYFIEMTNIDLREQLLQDQLEDMSEYTMPFGIIDNEFGEFTGNE